ncbi:putative hydrolase [Gautieria morchelliformis]|nr:putative hydrolase [Gautieria morchelliformis]
MIDPKLTQFKLLCFDVYGTLLDWESGIYESILPIIQRSQESWTRTEALAAFHSVETNLQAQNPTDLYTKVLADSYYTLAKRLGLPEDGQLTEASLAFGNSVGKWPIFPDTVEALARLSKHYRLVVLSNVDRLSFSHTQRVLEQGFQFDLVLTAQDIGSYKPDPTNFEYMLNSVKAKFGIEKHEVLVTANSLFHDHKPANTLGIASSWIIREGDFMAVKTDATYVFSFPTLGDMANAVVKEKRVKYY